MPNLHKLFFILFFGLFSVLTAATITSITSGDWDVPSTWDSAPAIPTSADDVIIANGHTVTVPGSITAEMLDITISLGGTLNGAEHFSILDVYGDWTNLGTFTTGSRNTVIFKGVGNQDVTPGGDEFNDLQLINTGAPGSSIAISGNIDINKNLTFTSGILDLTDGVNPTVEIGGNVTISNGAVWTKGAGDVTFDGTSQTFSDGNASANNLGNVIVDEP